MVAGVGGGVVDGGDQAGPAVAECRVDESGELDGVVEAGGERGLGAFLARCVGQREGGELLGAGKAGGAVAPGNAAWAGLGGAAGAQLAEGDLLGPSGAG